MMDITLKKRPSARHKPTALHLHSAPAGGTFVEPAIATLFFGGRIVALVLFDGKEIFLLPTIV